MDLTGECITIVSSDEDAVQVLEKPASVVKAEENNSSCSTNRRVFLQPVVTGKSVFSKFLAKCKETDSSNDMDHVVNKLWKQFHRADDAFTSSLFFIHLVEKLMDGASTEPYSQMKIISDELKYRTIKINKHLETKESKTSGPGNNVENGVDSKTTQNIRKLEKLIEVLHRKIAVLENREVDLNDSDDENSAYIQVSKYKDRICQVFRKICELRNTTENPLKNNIRFSGTRLPVVNKAIERFYNERKQFPDFRDMLRVIEKVNEMKNLHLSPTECQQIAELAFKELGETLKQQRQYEFYDIISCYVPENSKDPAASDPDLKQKLEQNQTKYGNRIDEVIDKYAQKQNDENLQPDIVASDASSENEDDEDENDDGVTSLSEPDAEIKTDCHDGNISSVPVIRNFQIRLTNVVLLPEWKRYNCDRKYPVASTPLYTPLSGGKKSECCESKCEPVAGSSKSTTNDFCFACSTKEMSNSRSLKRSTPGENEMHSKKLKLEESIVNENNKANDDCVIVDLETTTASSGKEDSMLSRNGVIDQSSMWKIVDVRSDVKFHSASGNSSENCNKNHESSRSKMIVPDVICDQNGDASDEEVKMLEPVRHVGDEVKLNIAAQKKSDVSETMKSNTSKKKSEIAEREKFNIDEKKLNSSGEKLTISEQKNSVVGEVNDTVVSEVKKPNVDVKTNTVVKQPSEIIDVDKLPNTVRKLNGPGLTQLIRNMKFTTFPSHSKKLTVSGQCNRMQSADTIVRSRPRTILPAPDPLKQVTISLKPKPTIAKSSMPTSAIVRSLKTKPLRPSLSGSLGSANADARRQNSQSSAYGGTFGGRLSGAAMAKHTMKTTEQKIVRNNVITCTTTVIKESMMQVRSNDSHLPVGSNPRTIMQSQRFSRTQQTQLIQKSNRRSPNTSNADEVITLD